MTFYIGHYIANYGAELYLSSKNKEIIEVFRLGGIVQNIASYNLSLAIMLHGSLKCLPIHFALCPQQGMCSKYINLSS